MQITESESIKNDNIENIKNLFKKKAWEKLKKLDLSKIDPNIKFDDESEYKGASLALFLTLKNQRNLFKKLDLTKADPNAKFEHESEMCKGVSLALALAFNNEWDALSKLDLSKADPNAKFEHMFHPHRGVTLAFKLADQCQWDLLKKLDLQKIDLNAKPESMFHQRSGMSVALILTDQDKWKLLKKLVKHNKIDIDTLQASNTKLFKSLIQNNQQEILKSIYTHVNFFDKKIVLNEQNFSLLESILLTLMIEYKEESALHGYLTNHYNDEEISVLITKFKNNKTIVDYLNYHLVKKYIELINQKNNIKENIENINKAFKYINISKDGMFYARTKECEASMFNSILENESLCAELVKNNAHHFPEHIGLSQASSWSAVERVKFARDTACFESGNTALLQDYLAESYEKFQKLAIEEKSNKKPNVNSFFSRNSKPSSGSSEAVIDESATNSCM